jgi:predicted ATPase
MITRFQVDGFKNLIGIDLAFGPFTCVAGVNAVGKSNLFDALMFLGSLADLPLLEAGMRVRDRQGKSSDIRTLFHAGLVDKNPRIKVCADMIVPSLGSDDLGQSAKASITFLRYELEIGYKGIGIDHIRPGLEILSEELTYIGITEAPTHLPFRPSSRWLKSAIRGRRTNKFISTEHSSNGTTIRLHQDGVAGRAREFKASTLPRTVLSTVNAVESPTALLARTELRAWKLLQLEPSALRAPDPYTAPPIMGADGSHLPATLYRLSHPTEAQPSPYPDVLGGISSRLSELVDDIRSVEVDRDEAREILTVMAVTQDGARHPARSLSDGTLRFLALATLEADPQSHGVICLEEPENGIHPERIKAILILLYDLAVDIRREVGVDNPLRQVIINTHSPTVVSLVPDNSLLWAESVEVPTGPSSYQTVEFRPLYDTWRQRSRPDVRPVQRGRIMAFLRPIRETSEGGQEAMALRYGFRSVVDREDMAQLRLWGDKAPPQK